MNKVSSKLLTSFKYFYLIIFFTLLSGFFHPLITETSFENVIYGVLILFVGLVGGILVYKGGISETKQNIFFISGFTLLGISLYLISEMTTAF